MTSTTTSIARAVGNFIWDHPFYSYMIADLCVATAYLVYAECTREPYPVVDFGCVESIDDDEEFTNALSHEELVLVDFYATWCGPCARAVPEYAHLSDEFASDGVKFCKVDTDKLNKLSEREGVEAMPTFKLYKAGVCVATMEGFDREEITRQIKLQTTVSE